MTTTKQKQQKAAEYAELLRPHLKPGQTVYTILRHVSASGMSRRISLVILDDKGETFDISGWAAHILGMRRNDRDGGLVTGGCGMDMGFHLVYSLSRALWPNGHPCIGEKCPSNDHSNGQPYLVKLDPCPGAPCGSECDHMGITTDLHRDGGYALRQRWL